MPNERADFCCIIVDDAPCMLKARHQGEHISILTPEEEDEDVEIEEDELGEGDDDDDDEASDIEE